MEDGLQIGDVVQLKSGGRYMTVAAIREDADGIKIECVWFEAHGMGGEFKTSGFFPPEALDKADR